MKKLVRCNNANLNWHLVKILLLGAQKNFPAQQIEVYIEWKLTFPAFNFLDG